MSKKQEKQDLPFDPWVYDGRDQPEDVQVLQDLTHEDFRIIEGRNPEREYSWLNPDHQDYGIIRSRGWQVDTDPNIVHFAKDPETGIVRYCELVLHSMPLERYRKMKLLDKKPQREFLKQVEKTRAEGFPILPVQEPGPMSRILNQRRAMGDTTPISAMQSIVPK